MWSFVAHFERGKLAVSQWHKKENNIARNEDFVDHFVWGKAPHKFAHYANDILSNLVGYCTIFITRRKTTFHVLSK